jgi:hypothetical protein
MNEQRRTDAELRAAEAEAEAARQSALRCEIAQVINIVSWAIVSRPPPSWRSGSLWRSTHYGGLLTVAAVEKLLTRAAHSTEASP